jgi:hypothetical protein
MSTVLFLFMIVGLISSICIDRGSNKARSKYIAALLKNQRASCKRFYGEILPCNCNCVSI